MNSIPLRVGTSLLLAGFTLALAACSSKPPHPTAPLPTTSGAAYETTPGFGGQVTVEAVTLTNTVVSIDKPNRRITLKHEDGTIGVYKVGPQAGAFDLLQPGDQVVVKAVDEIAIFTKPAGSPLVASASTLSARATQGSDTVGTTVNTISFTAKVTAMDYVLDVITLQLPGGQLRTVHVSEYVNLADFNIGDDVAVQITEATAIAIDKL
jgi:hypothetical protein